MTLPSGTKPDPQDAPHFCQRTADLYTAVDDTRRLDWFEANIGGAGNYCVSSNPHGSGWWVRRFGDHLPDYKDSLREAIDAAIGNHPLNQHKERPA
jgi:hypothetical protein